MEIWWRKTMVVMVVMVVTAGGGVGVSAKPIVDPGLFVIQGVSSCMNSTGFCMLGNNCTVDVDFLPDTTGGHCDGLREAFTPKIDFICCKYNPLGKATSEPPTTTLSSYTITDVFSLIDEEVALQQQQQQEMDYENLNPENLIDIVGVVTDFTGIVGLVTRPWTGTLPTRAPTSTTTTPPPPPPPPPPKHSLSPSEQSTTTSSTGTTNANIGAVTTTQPLTTTTSATGDHTTTTVSSSNQETTAIGTPFPDQQVSSTPYVTTTFTTNAPTTTIQAAVVTPATNSSSPSTAQYPATTHDTPEEGNFEEQVEVTESYNEIPTSMTDLPITTTLPADPATTTTLPADPATTATLPADPATTTTLITANTSATTGHFTDTINNVIFFDFSESATTVSDAQSETTSTSAATNLFATTSMSATTNPPSITSSSANTSFPSSTSISATTNLPSTTTSTFTTNQISATTTSADMTSSDSNLILPQVPAGGEAIVFPDMYPEDPPQALQSEPETLLSPDTTLTHPGDLTHPEAQNINTLESNGILGTATPTTGTSPGAGGVGVDQVQVQVGVHVHEPDYPMYADYQDQILLQPVNQRICGFKGPQHYVPDKSPSRILSGAAASTVEWCWAAAIMQRQSHPPHKFLCSGALVETNLILTSATCVSRLEGKDLSDYLVVLGDSNLLDDLPYSIQFHSPVQISRHPDYFTSGGAHVNDVGVVRLRDHATLSDNVCLVCVAQQSAVLPPASPCTVVGYGRLRLPPNASYQSALPTEGTAAETKGAKEGLLRQLSVPLLPSDQCEAALHNLTGSGILAASDSFLCSLRLDTAAACYNALDGGSPLACEAGGRWFLAGLVSWSKDCGLPGVPTVFTRVSAFTNWIQVSYLRMLGFITRPVYSQRTRWMYERLEKINKEFA